MGMSVWLTVTQAADWLANHLGARHYSVDELWRAIQGNTLQVHFWPTEPVTLGVFAYPQIEGEAAASAGSAEFGDMTNTHDLIATASGPVPISDYRAFSVALALSNEPEIFGGGPIGIPVYDRPEMPPLGTCFVVDATGQPNSLATLEFAVLVHVDNLTNYANAVSPLQVSPLVELVKYGPDGRELKDWRVNCAQTGGALPYLDMPKGNCSSEQPEPLLKALAMAAHVIAELGERLDALENRPGLHLNLKIDGKPNVRGIAMQLSEQARQLNHSGYGSGHRGFEERIRTALKATE